MGAVAGLVLSWVASWADPVPVISLLPESTQPLAANARRVEEALRTLGAPLPGPLSQSLAEAVQAANASRIQALLDPYVLVAVTLNPESRVKVQRGSAAARLQQGGYTPLLVKVINQSTVKSDLRVTSPQAGPVYAGMTPLSAFRLQREALKEVQEPSAITNRFLDAVVYSAPPMMAGLSGAELEYAILLVYSREAGTREATLSFDVGQGTQDLGFRGEVPVLFDVEPALPVQLRIRDVDGRPAAARLVFRDASGRVYPPQAKRLAPDFYFQEQIYRRDGEVAWLPRGRLSVEFSRGPEYRVQQREFDARELADGRLDLQLARWIDPAAEGFFSGDHHIHGAGCAHYTSPTEGVTPDDMFRQIEGEGLNVGCVLTWGPCFDYQRRFFDPGVNALSGPRTLMKYDLEISGFGSEAMGHVCLLNLRDQTYPGSEGTKVRGWPKWTTPVMRWAKGQGGFAGYAHSGSGLEVRAAKASARLFETHDTNRDRLLDRSEAATALLPDRFDRIDADGDGGLSEAELTRALDQAADRLPNLAVPEMTGVGAMEIGVSTALGVCDFISAMDTPRVAEWNMWYHLLNCGFPLKVSGETDFPCMSGDRVGQGRVYVQLGRLGSGPSPNSPSPLQFRDWCTALAAGRSYVSDGFAHALEFRVEGVAPGFGEVRLPQPGSVKVQARVAFAAEQPLSVAQGSRQPPDGRRWVGDTITAHGPIPRETTRGGVRRVELIVNGHAVASQEVPADGSVHALVWEVPVSQSSWVALRHFPQLHTNPVNVLVDGRPIRPSRDSARWVAATIRQLWSQRGKNLPESERTEAEAAFEQALAKYRQIEEEVGR